MTATRAVTSRNAGKYIIGSSSVLGMAARHGGRSGNTRVK
jgi:hypothetical protein